MDGLSTSANSIFSYKRQELARYLPLKITFYPLLETTTIEMLICLGWETLVVPVSQLGTPDRDKRGGPFVPGLATGTKGYLLSRLVLPTGTKGPFFSVFIFSIFSISIILLHFN